MEPTLAATALVGSVAAGFFLAMALRAHEARVSPEARPAMSLFAVWWMALALYATSGATVDLAASFGAEPLGVVILVEYLQKFALCIGLWGLMYYLAYILTGSRRLLLPLAVFYSLYYATILYAVTIGRPAAVAVEPWRTSLLYEAPVLDRLATALLLVVPPIVGAGTYLAIYRNARSRAQRFRIAALAAATLAWCVSLVAREADPIAGLPALLALASAFAARWAYEPPTWLRETLVDQAHESI